MYEAVGKARVQPVSSKVPVLILSTLTGEEAWRGVAWRSDSACTMHGFALHSVTYRRLIVFTRLGSARLGSGRLG